MSDITFALGVHIHFDHETTALLKRLVCALEVIASAPNREEKFMQQALSVLDQIESEVGNMSTVEASVETLVSNIVAQVAAAGADSPRLQTVLATIQANDARFAKLVTDNTPAVTPTPIPPPVNPTFPTWIANTAYAVGDDVSLGGTPPVTLECTTAGTSGATAPTGAGQDGTVTWDVFAQVVPAASGSRNQQGHQTLHR